MNAFRKEYEKEVCPFVIEEITRLHEDKDFMRRLNEKIQENGLPLYLENEMKSIMEKVVKDILYGSRHNTDYPASIEGWPDDATHAFTCDGCVIFGRKETVGQEIKVFRGSYFSPDWRAKNSSESYKKAWEWVVKNDAALELLTLDDNGNQILDKDLMFKSAACAASVTSGAGRASNVWVSRDGQQMEKDTNRSRSRYHQTGELVMCPIR